jgi:hypothetical protein
LIRTTHILATLIFILAFGLPLTAQSTHVKAVDHILDQRAAAVPASAENIDLNMYQRIMNEGFNHSHVMAYLSVLADDIGPRLTGSPNMVRANKWTRDQLVAMGCANAHIESWGGVRVGLAAGQHLGQNDFAGYRGIHRASYTLVAVYEWSDYWRCGLGQY